MTYPLVNSENEFIQDRIVFISLAAAGILNIILWIVALSKFGLSGTRVPLHFNIVYGIDFIAPARNIYQLPGIGLLIFFLNFFLGKNLYSRAPLLSYFLTLNIGVVQIFLLVSLLALVVLNV